MPESPTKPYKEPEIPSSLGWQHIKAPYPFHGSAKEANLYIASAQNQGQPPKGVIFYSLGWKNHPVERTEIIQDFQNKGYTVIIMPLINPGDQTGSMPENIAMFKSMVFDPNAPLYKIAGDLPIHILTHSTSGNLYQNALHKTLREGAPLPPIENIVHTAPFFAPANASQATPITEKLLDWHSSRNAHKHTGTPFFDRLYLIFFRGLAEKLLQEHPETWPTHGQVQEIKRHGSAFLMDDYQRPQGVSPPETFMFDPKDSFSCPEMTTKFARKIGAKIIRADAPDEANHNPLACQKNRDKISNALDAHNPQWHHARERQWARTVEAHAYDHSAHLTLPEDFVPVR